MIAGFVCGTHSTTDFVLSMFYPVVTIAGPNCFRLTRTRSCDKANQMCELAPSIGRMSSQFIESFRNYCTMPLVGPQHASAYERSWWMTNIRNNRASTFIQRTEPTKLTAWPVIITYEHGLYMCNNVILYNALLFIVWQRSRLRISWPSQHIALEELFVISLLRAAINYC